MIRVLGFLRRCVIASTAAGLITAVISTATADELLVSDRATNRILAFDAVSGAFTRVVSDSPLIDEPSGLTIGPGGFIYVSNLQTDVLKIDPVTGAATVFATGISGPGGVTYDEASNSIFVSEFGAQFNGDEVFQYDAAGALIRTIGTLSQPPTGRSGLIVHNGELYVSNFGLVLPGSVLKHDGMGGLQQFASGIGPSGPVLFGANGLAFDAEGDLYVAGLLGQNVVKYSVSAGMAGDGAQFGSNVPYPSGLLILEEPNGESLLITSLGNDNPADPIYGSFTFPGAIYKYATATGAPVNFLVGDFDRDVVVDGDDLTAWKTAFATNASADIEGDGDSDGADFLAWQRSLGNQGVLGPFQPTDVALYSPPQPGSSAIPEPTAGLLACCALWPLVRRRR